MAYKKNPTAKPDLTRLDTSKWRPRISYWRDYTDKFYDTLQSSEADFALNIQQRLYMRIKQRHQNTFITATRGSTKSYISQASDLAEDDLFPGKWISMVAPSKEQSRNIAKETNEQLAKNYPLFAKEYVVERDSQDEFILAFPCGSKYRTVAIQNSARGGNDHDITVEEVAQTGGQSGFNEQIFTSAFLPRVRKKRFVRGRKDLNERVQRKGYITSAGSKQTYAYRVMKSFEKRMAQGNKNYYVVGNSWEITVILGLKTMQEIIDQYESMSLLDFMREFESQWTGTTTSSLVRDEILDRSKCLRIAEFKHCGDSNCRYVISFDIAREEGQANAESALVVEKETLMTDRENPSSTNKYFKDIVYANSFEGTEHTTQAKYIKQIYANFRPPIDGKEYPETIVCVDANGYGMAVRDELMKDLHDGIPPFACINDDRLEDQTQPGSIRVMYSMKAGANGDNESDMVTYYETEFEHGRVRLLVDENEGLTAYKMKHKIKDDDKDIELIVPYKNSKKLRDQISNIKRVSEGGVVREKRVSTRIPRDLHSALKYGLRMSQRRELEEAKPNQGGEDEWEKEFKNRSTAGIPSGMKKRMPFQNNGRAFNR